MHLVHGAVYLAYWYQPTTYHVWHLAAAAPLLLPPPLPPPLTLLLLLLPGTMLPLLALPGWWLVCWWPRALAAPARVPPTAGGSWLTWQAVTPGSACLVTHTRTTTHRCDALLLLLLLPCSPHCCCCCIGQGWGLRFVHAAWLLGSMWPYSTCVVTLHQIGSIGSQAPSTLAHLSAVVQTSWQLAGFSLAYDIDGCHCGVAGDADKDHDASGPGDSTVAAS